MLLPPDPAAPVTASTAPEWVLTLSCPDRPGIVHAVSGVLAGLGGNITESQQFGSPVTGRFYMRVQVALAPASTGPDDAAAALETALAPVANEFDLTWELDRVGRHVPIVIMVSKESHCLHDLLFRQRAGGLPVDVVAVVGNHPDLSDLAAFYGVPFHHVPVTRDTKAQAEAELVQIVESTGAELVVLARYMQILSDDLCAQLTGRIINIHHSFLPSFKGARPYHQAFERGVKLIGATSHYVTGDLDEGPIIEQEVERVDHTRTPAELVGIGQDVERRTLARAVRWHAEHRVLLDGLRTVVFR